MATLTADGVNCSNGTLNGYYTGTAYNNTSFPLGSYVVGDRDTCLATMTLNQTSNVFYTNSGYQNRFTWFNYGGTTALVAGTWRNRGMINGGAGAFLVQRVA